MNTLPTIMLIQFRLSAPAAALEYESICRELGPRVRVKPVSALEATLSWQQPDRLLAGVSGVILGGSGDFDFDGNRCSDDPICAESRLLLERLSPSVSYLLATALPLLGICYGHQLLGAYHGVTVHHDAVQQKMRTHTVTLTPEGQTHPLFCDLPPTFAAQYGHKDVLAAVPDGAVLAATGGEECLVSAICYSEVAASVQFHPELSLADLEKRVAAVPGYLPDGVCVADIYTEAPDAHRLLRHFALLVSTAKQPL